MSPRECDEMKCLRRIMHRVTYDTSKELRWYRECCLMSHNASSASRVQALSGGGFLVVFIALQNKYAEALASNVDRAQP